MAFQTKSFASIAASMINWMKATQQKVTDFSIGSIVRSMLEAIAAEIDQLYQQMFNGLIESIPVATYNSFNFTALPVLPTSGLIRVTIATTTAATPISAGTTFTFAGSTITYTSENDMTITTGNTFVDVLVDANVAGSIGNCPQGQVFTMTPAPNGFVSATNLAAFANGQDAETDAQRQIRFNAFIASLPRGTVAAIEYGLQTTAVTDAQGNISERVVYASVVEPYLTDASQPVSLVNCYIHNGVGNTSSALVTLATQIVMGYTDANGKKVPGWKAAGVKVTVEAATEIPINIGGTLTIAAGSVESTVAASANLAASAYITGLGIGQTFQVATLIDQVMSVPGVTNFVPSDIAAPVAPTLGSSVAGALAAATYYVEITYVAPAGETISSPSASLAVVANSLLTAASPAMIAGVTGWNIYAGTAVGSLQKQNAVPLAIGTSYLEPTTGLIAGATPPAASTARFVDIATSSSQKLMPGTLTIS